MNAIPITHNVDVGVPRHFVKLLRRWLDNDYLVLFLTGFLFDGVLAVDMVVTAERQVGWVFVTATVVTLMSGFSIGRIVDKKEGRTARTLTYALSSGIGSAVSIVVMNLLHL